MEAPAIYDTQTMVAAIDTRRAYDATMFLTNKFFPTSLDKINDPVIAVDITKGSRKIAAYQSHKVAGTPQDKTGFTTQQIEPPTLCPYYDIDVDDILKRAAGERPFGGRSPMERASEKLGWYIYDLIQRSNRRIEVTARECLLTGKVTFTGKGISREVDYLRNADHTVDLSGADLWSATTSDPIGDLETWRNVVAENSGRKPDFGIMGSGAWNAFINHDGVQKQLDNRRIMVGAIAPAPDIVYPKAVVWRGNLNGLDIYTYDEWFIDPDTGLSTAMIPSANVILGCSEAQNRLYYGLVKTDVDNIISVPILPRTWVEHKPSVRYLEAGSSPLIAMHEPDTTLVAEVL